MICGKAEILFPDALNQLVAKRRKAEFPTSSTDDLKRLTSRNY
jgi:hypothetical protein